MRGPSPHRLDVAVTCGFAGIAVTEALLATPSDDPLAFVVPSAVALAVPLLVRRHRPALALVGVLAVMAVQRAVLGEIWDAGSSLAIPMCAVYSAGAYLPRQRSLAATGVAIVVTSILDVGADGSDWPFLTLILGAMWVAGMVARRYWQMADQAAAYAAELEVLQAEREENAARAERTRIARELHDVVAHCVSTIVVQAEAGQALIEADRSGASESFAAIQDTGRQAMVELRRLLGLLRGGGQDDGGPQPTLAHLDALLADVRRTGLHVSLEIAGTPRELPPGVDLSAYRILQESLTNTVKHGRAQRAAVLVRYEAEALTLEIVDDGEAASVTASATAPGGGHGLVGMTERAHLLGGTLQSGRTHEGGYAVRARLPLS
ncbi:sensor histidine kinase [Nocardioides albidus]|nr:histidine kinase [Nocardioides albidus]